jgi:hypothetical protein
MPDRYPASWLFLIKTIVFGSMGKPFAALFHRTFVRF